MIRLIQQKQKEMEKSKKQRLSLIVSSLTSQDQKSSKPTLLIQKNLQSTMKQVLTSNGFKLLNKQINCIVQKEQKTLNEKKNEMQEEEFQQMKKKLTNYGKNQYEYLINRIIKFERKTPTPLKRIHTINENRVIISKNYNFRLCQKIDSIIESQKVNTIKEQNINHLNSKLDHPLQKNLKKYSSLHSTATSSSPFNKRQLNTYSSMRIHSKSSHLNLGIHLKKPSIDVGKQSYRASKKKMRNSLGQKTSSQQSCSNLNNQQLPLKSKTSASKFRQNIYKKVDFLHKKKSQLHKKKISQRLEHQ